MDFGSLMTGIASWIAIIIGTLAWFYNKFSNKKSRIEIANELSTDIELKTLTKKSKQIEIIYKNFLKKVLNKLDDRLGRKKLSFKALSIHFQWALIYTTITFLLIWFFSGYGKIGNLLLLPEYSLIGRIILTLSIFLFLFYIHIVQKYNDIIEEKIYSYSNNFSNKTIFNIFNILISISFFFIYFSIYNNELIISILLLFIIYFVIDSIKMLLIFLLMAIILGTMGLLEVGLELVGLGSVGLVLILVLLKGELKEYLGIFGIIIITGILGVILLLDFLDIRTITLVIVVIMLFYFILPLINTFFDFISLSISRKFINAITNDYSLYKILMHIIFDFIIAILLLILLAASTIICIELINIYIISNYQLNIDIYSIINSYKSNPFEAQNLWITFMLFSTLIPTLIHLVFALAAVILSISKHNTKEEIISILKSNNPSINALGKPIFYYTTVWSAIWGILLFSSMFLIHHWFF